MTHRTEECCKECSGWEPALHECSCQCHYSPTDESVVAELAVFWNEIALNLPKSIERSALGDEKIFRAFQIAYPKMREYLLTSLSTQHKAEVRERITTYVNKKFFEGVVIDPLELYETLTNKES